MGVLVAVYRRLAERGIEIVGVFGGSGSPQPVSPMKDAADPTVLIQVAVPLTDNAGTTVRPDVVAQLIIDVATLAGGVTFALGGGAAITPSRVELDAHLLVGTLVVASAERELRACVRRWQRRLKQRDLFAIRSSVALLPLGDDTKTPTEDFDG